MPINSVACNQQIIIN